MTAPPPLTADRALFLDFDGTLVAIAPRPDAILVPDGLGARLAALQGWLGGALAIVSGRGVAELERYLTGFPGPLIGGHGAEAAPAAWAARLPAADHPDPGPVQAALAAKAGEAEAWLYEEKRHGGVLHYRADPALAEEAAAFATALAARHRGFAVQPAKMAVELRPSSVGKDHALRAVLAHPPFAGRAPVYAGDDTTDEPAMAAALAAGGGAIKIGTGESVAPHRLLGPDDLAEWLFRAIS